MLIGKAAASCLFWFCIRQVAAQWPSAFVLMPPHCVQMEAADATKSMDQGLFN
jgi:hypothetical protein